MLSLSMLGILSILGLLFGSTFGAPSTSQTSRADSPKKCAQVNLRKEWRDLKPADQQAYTRAVRCLQTSPAKDSTLDRKFTRFDEFIITHTNVADGIHGVGHFLPWHRQFGYIYETTLRKECNYTGPFPYWDWRRDADGSTPIRNSPLFDPTTGFGGDNGRGCVNSGPFANLTLHVGPGKQRTDHCLTRSINDGSRALLSTKGVQAILDKQDYDSMWNSLDGLPFNPSVRLHDGGHFTVGGDMTNFYTSPNDPIFYLHHAGLDYVWWTWQQVNPEKRLSEIAGRSTPTPPYGAAVTLDFALDFAGFSPAVPIRTVMDTSYEPHCYAYA